MRFFLLLYLFCFQLNFFAQSGTTLYFHLDKLIIKEKTFSDTFNFRKYETNAINQFKFYGYVGITLNDSIIEKNARHYYYNFSHQFKTIVLSNADSTITVKYKNFTSIQKSINKQLTALENNGYPFAKIQFIKEEEELNKLYLTYKIDSGDQFIIDQIIIKSKSKFQESTILSIINLQAGDIYNESKINKAQIQLSNSGLYKLMRPAEIIFKPGKATVYFYIEKERASDADGFVGFQQDQVTSKLALNGYFNLSLHNSFNRAEVIEVNWKNNPNKSQNLKINFEYPYILKTPIGIATKINLFKQDSTFVRADSYFEIAYSQSFYKFGLFYQIENSSTTLQIANSNFRNYVKNTAGLSLYLAPLFTGKLKFYHPFIQSTSGFFKYKADSSDNSFGKGNNMKYMFKYGHKIDFLKYFKLNNSLQFEGLISNQPMTRNELVFFGGLRSIRGFYELELNGNFVAVLNNEIEFTPVSLLSLKILYDYAQFHSTNFFQAHAIGFGFGLNAGNYKLEIILANGWIHQNPILLSNSKIHLGFVSNF